MTSSRLPGKMNLALGRYSVLGALIERLKLVPELDRIVLATTEHPTDDVLADIARRHAVDVFRGSEDDVLGRVCGAVNESGAEICVEITGDCPLSDPAMISAMIREFRKTRGVNAYIANVSEKRMGAPSGLDVQVFEAEGLRQIEHECHDAGAREHVSLPFYRADGIRRWAPRLVEFFPDELCRRVWVSLDYPEDYQLIRDIYVELFEDDPSFDAGRIIEAGLARSDAMRACLAKRGL